MAVAAEGKIYRGPGTLYAAPTTLSPAAGTALGEFVDVVCFPIPRSAPILAEEHGGEEVDRVRLGRDWIVMGRARQWDPDVLASYMASSSAGTSTQGTFYEPEGSAGIMSAATARALLWAPQDPSGIGFYAKRCAPDLDARARFAFGLYDETAPVIVWRAYRFSNNVAIRFGRLSDMGSA